MRRANPVSASTALVQLSVPPHERGASQCIYRLQVGAAPSLSAGRTPRLSVQCRKLYPGTRVPGNFSWQHCFKTVLPASELSLPHCHLKSRWHRNPSSKFQTRGDARSASHSLEAFLPKELTL
eukprot:3894691-Rhodomonas_salina.2